MNKIFKVIWNNAKHCYVVASELAKSHSKSNSSRTIRRAAVALGIAAAVFSVAGSALAVNGGGHLDGNNYIGDSPNYNVTIDSDVTGNVYGHKGSSENVEEASVTMTSGTVKQNVYGGYVYEGSGKADSNRVNISGGIIGEDVYTGNVYGGYVKEGTGDVSSNSVNISGGTIGYVDSVTGGNVYGGYIDRGSGKVASNSVNISGNSTTINGYVYGGFSYSGDAASNSVNIKDATVNSSIYGVYVDNPSGNAIDNSVTINGGIVGGSEVYGARINTEKGKAASNSVNISDTTFSSELNYTVFYGASTDEGDSIFNSVSISGLTIINDNYKVDVYGGLSDSGNAESNSVNINGGLVYDEVYGGSSFSGNAASNSVNISGNSTSVSDSVFGGYVSSGSGNAASNSVNISGGSETMVYGGYVKEGTGNAASNSVNISGNSTTINGGVYGGYVYFGSGNAASNSVNISGGTIKSEVYGGCAKSGDANENQITMTGGEITYLDFGNIYGGYSETGNAASNSVSISGDSTSIVNSIYGGYVKSDYGNANSNSVNIIGGTIGYVENSHVYGGNVYGGWSNSGDAASNSVNISGGKVEKDVYGGYVNQGTGSASYNLVNISGGTVNQNVYGGIVYGDYVYGISANAGNNSVSISGVSTSIIGDVYGGWSRYENVASNSVNISGGTVGGNVYGAHIEEGPGIAASNSVYISGDFTSITGFVCGGAGKAESSAFDNCVSISGGTIERNVFGGRKGPSIIDVAGNSVNISGDKTKVNCNVYGGYGYDGYGNAASNSVNISGGTVSGNVYGGCMGKTTDANTIGNLVNISGGTIEHNVFGGYVTEGPGNSASNSVNIGGDTTKILGNIYGGVASYTGYANYNQVNISTGSIKIVYGGYSYEGNVKGNSVTISGNSTSITDSVYGGYVESDGYASNNSVNIKGGTISSDIYGGYVKEGTGDVVSNSVNISGGTFDSESKIYAGYVDNSNISTIFNNVVNLGGTVTGLNNVEIYGYYFNTGSGSHHDNELHLGGTKTIDSEENSVVTSGTAWQGKTGEGSINNKVKTIANFETIALHSLTWNETLPALAAESFKYDNSTVLGGNVTLDITNLTFDDDSLSGTMTLLQSDEIDNFNGIKLKYSDSAATAIPDEGQIVKNETAKSSTKGIEFTYDTKHSLSLSDSNKKINYTIANGYKKAELGSMKWSDGGHTFSDNDSIYPNGLEVSLGSDFNVDGSETKEDNSQLTLLDLSQTSGIIKESVDTTKRVDVQKNAASEMTFEIARKDSIKSDSEKKKVIYTVGKSKDVTKVIFNSAIDWNSETPYYSNSSFDFSNAKKIDASKLEFIFTNDQLAELSDSSVMTLVSNASNQPEGAEVAYKNDATSHSQGIDYITDNGAVLSGSMSGVINTSDSAVKFDVSQTSLDSISLTEWDGAKEASALLEGWSANTDGVMITAASFDPNVADAEKTILTASTNVFKDENIDETIRYKNDSLNNNLENGVKISGFQTGGVKATDEGKALTYFAMEKTINKFDLANWDGENDTKVSSTWKIADGASVETDGMSILPGTDEEKQVFILKSDTEGYFANVAINGENVYSQKQFTDSNEDESVVLDITQKMGVTLDEAKTNIVYKVGSKDVTSIKLNSVLFKDGAELLSRDKYNYSKLASLDTDAFNINFEKPETITVNQSMTLLNANDTLTDIAAIEKSNAYSYSPVSGVTMDAIILSRLEAKSGKVALTAVSNKADKLTFGNVDWLDKGALIDHKTMLNNVSFDGAAVDTTKIAFSNKQKLDADMQMTLVSDFGDSVGTITGSKYKVGTAYEGEGSAYLDGSDLKFKIKTGAGLSDETHTTVMSMDAGIAVLTAGSEQIGTAIEGLGNAANIAPDGTATFVAVGGGSARYKTGSHVDTNSWNIALAVGKNLEKKDGTLEYGLFGEYGRGNYTLHMNGVEDAGSGNSRYTGGGLITKWTNSHNVYTEASFRLGNVKENTSNILHDGAGNGYGYDKKAKYKGGHIGFGKKYREDENTELEIYGKFFYNEREGINFAAGADQYSLDKVRSRILRAGFRLASTDRKWNRYGGIAYDHEFGGESTGSVNGNAIRSASIKGGTLRGEFGIRREATKTNPWKTDISLYGFTGKRKGFGGNIAVEYHF
ncbi:MAG: hypothetical protein II961_07055 [Candidatus Riflebacteria bacterium]|nr:hypothetical protein [Candidatus Riflebacteria bacterium]